MRHLFLKIILAITCLLIVGSVIIIWDQSRSYYYSQQNRCVTIWKRPGGRCFVIPYKYTLWLRNPTENYFETETNSYLDMYWLSDSSIFIDNHYYQNDLHIIYHFNDEIHVYDLQDLQNWYKIGNPIIDTITSSKSERFILKDKGIQDTVDQLMPINLYILDGTGLKK